MHQKIPKEEASVEGIGALEHRCGDRHLAVGYRRQPKRRTQGDGESWKDLAASRRRITNEGPTV
jgi:hypothetical protein